MIRIDEIDPANEAYATMLRQSALSPLVDLVCYPSARTAAATTLDYVYPATGLSCRSRWRLSRAPSLACGTAP